jgi:putative permease
LAAICFPLGIILYIRMWRFRLRLANDIKKLIVTNKLIVDEIDNIQQK